MAKAYSYIRFSSPEQSKGDSLRRQIELSKSYAEKNNLIFDESLRMEDRGISAFNGANVERGALGEFLRKIEQQEIPVGSYLLVESLDRLSRTQVLTAFNQFTSIIQKGITIVTLSDNMKYTADSVNANFSELLISLTIMSRAHEESKVKSLRLSAAWDNKRKNLDAKKLTSRAPSWLKLNEDKTKFDLIEDRVKVVQSIFKMSADGFGKWQIARILNEKKVPVFKRSRGWSTTNINNMLNGRAVLGEFQPKKKGEPAGDLITDYFPAIIDEGLFYKVQIAKENRRQQGGPAGKHMRNLFTGIGKCAYCGDSMIFDNTGEGPKGSKRLVCNSGIRRLGCVRKGWQYKHFEQAFLAQLNGLDLNDINPQNEANIEIEKCRNSVYALEGQINEKNIQLERLAMALCESDSPPIIFVKKATQLESEVTFLKEELKEQQRNLNKKEQSISNLEQKHLELKSFINLMDELKGDELFNLRVKLKQSIVNLIKYVELYPDGDITSKTKTPRFFAIKYKTGALQCIMPEDKSPMDDTIMLYKVPREAYTRYKE